jgi:hypothetical protein
MSVRLSAWKNSAPNRRILMKIDIWVFLKALTRKFKFLYNLTAPEDEIHLRQYLAGLFLECEMFHTKVAKQIKTHILCSIIYPPTSKIVPLVTKCRQIMYRRRRPRTTTWRVRIACWITKATNTISKYVILIVFPRRQLLYTRVSLLRNTYTVVLLMN